MYEREEGYEDYKEEMVDLMVDKEYIKKEKVRIQKEADEMHPRDLNGNKINICGSFTGFMGCCKKYENSELNLLGLGITNYFKIIKKAALCCLFLKNKIY